MYFTCLIMQDPCTCTFCIVCFALIEKMNVFRINFPLSIPLFIYFRNNRMLLYLLLVPRQLLAFVPCSVCATYT